MRLLKVEIRGYKRLADVVMNLDASVVAVVGPNEAGKSSLLEALREFDSDSPVPRTSWSRDTSGAPHLLRCHWLLDHEDQEALSDIPECVSVRYFRHSKRDDRHGWDVYPLPERNMRLRKAAYAKLGEYSRSKTYLRAAEASDVLHNAITSALDALASLDESQSNEALAVIDAGKEALTAVQPRTKSVERLLTQLEALAAHERRMHPRDEARARLMRRRPRFATFSAESRDLHTSYDLEEVAEDPPEALKNLAATAGLDLVALRDAVQSESYAAAETIRAQANRKLDEVFKRSWRQAPLAVQLRTDENVLRVLIMDQAQQYTDIAERSDGLKMFAALLVFLSHLNAEVPPILLIDEAEQHLHYDAQADLVRMLTAQNETSKVIYTTHSAGCLPEDLGAAVRVITPVPETERSVARIGFWDDTPGFDSLLMAMGASTFAFSSARRAVLAEGAVETILLPRLLREALDVRYLGFQVAPGLSSASISNDDAIKGVAARLAFVVDNDAEGRRIGGRLRRNGFDEATIVIAALSGFQDNTLEDFLDTRLYLGAVNEELRRSHGPAFELSARSIAGPMVPRSVARACARKGVNPPNKANVARRLIEQESTVALLSSQGARSMRTVGEQLLRAVGLARSG